MMRILLLAAWSVSLFHAQALESTGGLVNGRGWETSPEVVRIAYIIAVKDYVYATAMLTDSKIPGNQLDFAAGFTVDDYIKELNRLYSDRENITIPVVLAIKYVTTKLRGDKTKAELERSLVELRGVTKRIRVK